MKAEKQLLEVLESLGPEKKRDFINFVSGSYAWDNNFTREEKDRILEAVRGFAEETKAQQGKKE